MENKFLDGPGYQLSHLKLDIGGTKGNVFYVLGTAKDIVRQVEGDAAANTFFDMATGQPWMEMGGGAGDWDYNCVLRYIKEKTGITFVSSKKLNNVDEDLYEIENREERYL